MVAAAFFFALMSALVKIVAARVPISEAVFARSLVGLVLSVWMLRRARVPILGVRRGLLLVRGLLGFAALSFYFYAISELPLADATVLQYTNPVWTAFLAGLLLRERVTPRVVGASVVALVGVALVARPAFLFGADGGSLPLVPVLAGLAGALSSAGAYVAVRSLRTTDHALVVVLYFPLVATPASVPAMIPDAVWPLPVDLLLLVAIGVLVQIAQVFMTRGIHLEPAGRATAVSYVQVVFAYLWGVVAFGERPTVTGLMGAALVIGAALFVALPRRAEAREVPVRSGDDPS
ncbi:MAG: DMT family transporter [Deltaproteobacteria bacterium]|nr:MAG: DMT family transporter [Deltaproteobacteria bacterium]